MRILLITAHPYSPPWNDGVKNIVRRLTQYLSINGNDVIIICPDRDHSAQQVGEFGEEILPFLSTASGMGSHARLWFSMTRHIHRITQEKRPDVALAFVSASLFLGPRALMLRSLLGSRLTLYISGLSRPLLGFNWFLQNIEIMVGSPFLLRWFPDAAVAYPVTPVHLKPVESVETPHHTRNAFSLLYLGWASRERGVEYLLKGLSIARQRTKQPLQLLLAMSDLTSSRKQQLEHLITDLGIEEAVSVRGNVDVNEAYSAADVVVIPRQEPIRMSFPVRILESLSYSKPVITTSVCDMGQLVQGCGLEVDPDDPDDLARAIVRLADNPDLYRQLSDNCSSVLQKYAPDRTLATIESVLRRDLSERN